MENQFVPYELAVKIKELGFNEPCLIGVIENETYQGNGFSFTNFNNNIHDFVLPLWQQAFDWFMENYWLVSTIGVSRFKDKYSSETYGFNISNITESIYSDTGFETYEQARVSCFEKLIELIKNK